MALTFGYPLPHPLRNCQTHSVVEPHTNMHTHARNWLSHRNKDPDPPLKATHTAQLPKQLSILNIYSTCQLARPAHNITNGISSVSGEVSDQFNDGAQGYLCYLKLLLHCVSMVMGTRHRGVARYFVIWWRGHCKQQKVMGLLLGSGMESLHKTSLPELSSL